MAPTAVKDAEVPAQMGDGVFTITTGKGVTVTVTNEVSVQPLELPITLYSVVVAGLAVTLAPVVPLNPVDGDHAYVLPPLAVKTVEAPAQIGEGALVVTFKLPPTVTVVACMPLQPVPVSDTLTGYVVVELGLTVGFGDEEVNPAGLELHA